MSFRLAVCLTLFAATARANPIPSPPDDLWAALDTRPTGEPWLARVPGCGLAPVEVLGPFRPYTCFPPLSATVGVTAQGDLLSFESPSRPACGDALPTRIERRSATGTENGIDLTAFPAGVAADSDAALAHILGRAFSEGVLALRDGFSPPAPFSEAAHLESGDTVVSAAVVLGPPLAGQLLWLDLENRRLVLSSPTRSTALGKLPVTVLGKNRPSISEAVVTPDGRHLIVRLEGLKGSPCDPATLVRLTLDVPSHYRTAISFPSPVGETMRRCQRGERPACEALCTVGHCRPLAAMGGLSVSQIQTLGTSCGRGSALDCAALRVLGQDTCRREGQHSEACRQIEDFTVPVMVKGGPPTIAHWRHLDQACRAGETASCDELVRRFASQPFYIPKNAAQKAHQLLIEQLTRRCAYHDGACRERDAARARAP